jgi:putative oxidoreductase
MPPLRSLKRAVRVFILWGLTLLLVAIFLNAGMAKLSSQSGWAKAFVTWGFPAWFRVLVGVLESCAASLILIPRTVLYGCALVILVMAGAMATHIFHNQVLPYLLAS